MKNTNYLSSLELENILHSSFFILHSSFFILHSSFSIFLYSRSHLLSEQQDSDEGAEEEGADGAELIDLAGDEGTDKDGYTDPELPRRFRRCREILRRHQEQAGSSEKTDYGWTQSQENMLYGGMMLVLHQELGDDDHQDERRQDDGEGSGDRTEDAHPMRAAGVDDSRVAYVGG